VSLPIRGITATKISIQKLVSSDDAQFVGRYPLARRVYLNTIVGFGSSFNAFGDATGAGVSGDELNLAKCLVDPQHAPLRTEQMGLVPPPGGAFCEDFVEYRRCSGGLRPGKKCTADSDCSGAGVVADGTCPTAAACPGVTAEHDACANNPSGIPTGGP
jgi:hypothetical protein